MRKAPFIEAIAQIRRAAAKARGITRRQVFGDEEYHDEVTKAAIADRLKELEDPPPVKSKRRDPLYGWRKLQKGR